MGEPVRSQGARIIKQVARGRYRKEPLRTRAHLRARRLTAPLGAIVEAALDLTAPGPVLDIGTGHGLIALGMAEATGRSVLGIDVHAEKLDVARRAAAVRPALDVDFEVVSPRWQVHGDYAVIVVADVLYLLPPDRRRQLVASAARSLCAGGALLVKETDDHPAWKRRWTRTQEALAVRTWTRAPEGDFDPPTADEVVDWMVAAGLRASTTRLDAWRPWPHYLATGLKG